MSRFFSQHHSVLHQVICLLLCVSAWRGPIPVLHDHGWLNSSDLLDQHEQRFHRDADGCFCSGLHWHLAFPEDVTGRELPERDRTAPELAAFACAVASLPTNEVAFATNVDCVVGLEFYSDFADTHGDGSVADQYRRHVSIVPLLSDVPLCVVTGVCLI